MNTIQTVLVAFGVWFLSNWGWDQISGSGGGGDAGGNGGTDSTGGAGGSGTGGGGGAGGSGSGGDGSADYAALASAIEALAAGVRLPNIQTVTKVILAAGTYELVAGIGGQKTCVLAYAITGSAAINTEWKNGTSVVWRIDTEAAAGKAGANLATAWPGFLFATSGSSALNVTVSAAAVVAVTYWQETE